MPFFLLTASSSFIFWFKGAAKTISRPLKEYRKQSQNVWLQAHTYTSLLLFSFFFPSLFYYFYLSSLFFYLSLLYINSRNSDPGSHSRGSSPLPTNCGSCLALISQKGFSPYFRRQLTSNCAYPHARCSHLAAGSYFFFAKICSKSHHGCTVLHQHYIATCISLANSPIRRL